MHTPSSFDYDLWTKEIDGEKHYFARVKRTGEETEISHEVMSFLRSEEKRLRRELMPDPNIGSILSLDCSHNDEFDSWLQDDLKGISEMETPILVKEFCMVLSPVQKSVFCECFLHGKTATRYAADHGIARQSVSETISQIRKKAKNFF